VFTENPLSGVGISSFPVYNRALTGSGNVVHNSYLTTLSETGIIGIGLLALILVSAVRGLFQAKRALQSDKPNPLLTPIWAVLLMLVATGIGGMYVEVLNLKMTWLVLGLAQAVYQVHYLEQTGVDETADQAFALSTKRLISAEHRTAV
jgi:O-antigen ligase